MSDLDIHRAAHLVMKQHGTRAMARSRIADLSAIGDDEGVTVWSRITVAIEALGRPPSGSIN